MSPSDLGGSPLLAVEVSGALTGNIPVPTSLIGTLVEAIAQITSAPVKKVVIHLIEFRAEIRIVSDRADRIVRVAKFRNIAEVYNKAMLEADKIWFFSEEMKQEYLKTLGEDYVHQFKALLHSE